MTKRKRYVKVGEMFSRMQRYIQAKKNSTDKSKKRNRNISNLLGMK